MLFLPIHGNTMATKNQIAHAIWIMKRIPILWAKSYKQNCLEYFWQERVGMIAITRRFAATQRTGGFFLDILSVCCQNGLTMKKPCGKIDVGMKVNWDRDIWFLTFDALSSGEKEGNGMGSIVEAALYGTVGKLFLLFVIVPAGIIFLGYVIYMIVKILQELRKK